MSIIACVDIKINNVFRKRNNIYRVIEFLQYTQYFHYVFKLDFWSLNARSSKICIVDVNKMYVCRQVKLFAYKMHIVFNCINKNCLEVNKCAVVNLEGDALNTKGRKKQCAEIHVKYFCSPSSYLTPRLYNM